MLDSGSAPSQSPSARALVGSTRRITSDRRDALRYRFVPCRLAFENGSTRPARSFTKPIGSRRRHGTL